MFAVKKKVFFLRKIWFSRIILYILYFVALLKLYHSNKTVLLRIEKCFHEPKQGTHWLGPFRTGFILHQLSMLYDLSGCSSQRETAGMETNGHWKSRMRDKTKNEFERLNVVREVVKRMCTVTWFSIFESVFQYLNGWYIYRSPFLGNTICKSSVKTNWK